MNGQCCDNCVFYKSIKPTGERHAYGQCRYNPPQMSIDKDGDALSFFPTVTPADWCGRWRWVDDGPPDTTDPADLKAAEQEPS